MIELKLDQKGVQELVSSMEDLLKTKDQELAAQREELTQVRKIRDRALELLAYVLRKHYEP